MITALISTLTGLVSGSVPNLLKEWTDSREHKREVKMLGVQTKLQIDLAKVQGATKVAELDREIDVTAYKTTSDLAKASMKPIGIAWVDAWNSALRPFAATIIILLFAGMASCYTYEVLTNVEDIRDAVELLWGSLIGESIQAVLGFLFGYRSARK